MKAAIGNVMVIQQAFEGSSFRPLCLLTRSSPTLALSENQAVDTAGKGLRRSADLCDFAKTLAANAK